MSGVNSGGSKGPDALKALVFISTTEGSPIMFRPDLIDFRIATRPEINLLWPRKPNPGITFLPPSLITRFLQVTIPIFSCLWFKNPVICSSRQVESKRSSWLKNLMYSPVANSTDLFQLPTIPKLVEFI